MTKILYVPLDERACNYVFPQKLAAMTDDLELLVPPRSWMGFKKRPADFDAIWQWLFENAPACQYAILSVDTLVYGNIINSRTHHRTRTQCAATLENFRRLKRENPHLHIHAFNLVARVAAYDGDMEDPDYWAFHGRDIWQYTYLCDKCGRGEGSPEEATECDALKNAIPADFLRDFLDRRAVDRATNLACVDLAREGVFDVLTIPKDDTAEYGYAAMDQQAVAQCVRDKCLMDRVLVYPGADEVGSVLLARVFCLAKHYRPRVYLRYSSTLGPWIVPHYEDRPLNEGVKAQIASIGGVVEAEASRSDCMLALNSPGKHMIESIDQYHKDLTFSSHRNLNEFFSYIRSYREDYGKPIGLAEVAVCNGCENECMDLALLTGTYERLSAAGGWNTSMNTVGVVLAQTVIAAYYHGFESMPLQKKRSDEFLAGSLCADWLCQSNVLHHFLMETRGRIDPYGLEANYDEAEAYFRRELQSLLNQKFPNGLKGGYPKLEGVKFHWDGVFYYELDVSLCGERPGE